MKNFKKYLGVIVFSAVAMTAIPVSGSFVRPAVVKAEEPTQIEDTITGKVSHEEQKVIVTLADTASNLDNYTAYLWGTNKDTPEADKITSSEGLSEKKIEVTDITKTRLFFKHTDGSIKFLDFSSATDVADIKANADNTAFTNITTDYQYREKKARMMENGKMVLQTLFQKDLMKEQLKFMKLERRVQKLPSHLHLSQ